MEMKKVSSAQVKHFSRAMARSALFIPTRAGRESPAREGFSTVEMLPDGDYDVLVVDVDPNEDDTHSARLDLVIVSGVRKGEVVSLRASGLVRDATGSLGLPATLRIIAGVPRLELEDAG